MYFLNLPDKSKTEMRIPIKNTRKIKKIEREHRSRCLKKPTQKNRIRRYISSSILKGSGINGQETRYQY